MEFKREQFKFSHAVKCFCSHSKVSWDNAILYDQNVEGSSTYLSTKTQEFRLECFQMRAVQKLKCFLLSFKRFSRQRNSFQHQGRGQLGPPTHQTSSDLVGSNSNESSSKFQVPSPHNLLCTVEGAEDVTIMTALKEIRHCCSHEIFCSLR